MAPASRSLIPSDGNSRAFKPCWRWSMLERLKIDSTGRGAWGWGRHASNEEQTSAAHSSRVRAVG